MISVCIFVLILFRSTIIVCGDVADSTNPDVKIRELPNGVLEVNITGSDNFICFVDSRDFTTWPDFLKNCSNANLYDNENSKKKQKDDHKKEEDDKKKEKEDYTKDKEESRGVYSDCTAALVSEKESFGVYSIKIPDLDLQPFKANCIADKHGGNAWTVIQRRKDGSTDFSRDWKSYELGFGSPKGEHFLGLEKIHALTKTKPHKLWINLEDKDGKFYEAKYGTFSIGNADEKYKIQLGDYSGDAGNSMKEHNSMKFSTFDSDNDESPDENCAAKYKTGWWLKQCGSGHPQSNLNGQYFKENDHGIIWQSGKDSSHNLKYARMSMQD